MEEKRRKRGRKSIDALYEEQFGDIPNDPLERVTYILGKKVNSEKYNKEIKRIANRLKRIKNTKLEFDMWKIVKPSARPRVTTRLGYNQMYVPHAKENGNWFQEFAKANNLPFIDTPCTVNMKIYEKTPMNFSKRDKVLAELGILRPWRRTGDVDNYAKGILDAIQHGMLADDCLVICSKQELFYSIKPHAHIEIIYMNEFPKTN